jgi:maleylpyruvate isomerase
MTDVDTAALSRHLGWMSDGHRYFLGTMDELSNDDLTAPIALPGWTGRHLLSHVGHNARAVGRLAHWAATGEVTPMYAGPSDRAAEIELGAGWHPDRLRSFVEMEQDALATALEKLNAEQWAAEVVTAQGRHVTAATIPWLRTRELWIHAVDLHSAADFSDFPPALLDELIVDVLNRRRDVHGEVLHVRPTDRDLVPASDAPPPTVWFEGRSADLVRWLTGRGTTDIAASDHSALPTLKPWL